jgi:hypothetical protein
MAPPSFIAAAAVAAASVLGLTSAYPDYVPLNPNGNNVGRPPVDAIGHVNPAGGGSRNAYGQAFANAGLKWTVDLCMADSDGDNLTNGFELGDPCCVWVQGATPAYTSDISHPGLATGPFAKPVSRVCSSVKCFNSTVNPCGGMMPSGATPAHAGAGALAAAATAAAVFASWAFRQ